MYKWIVENEKVNQEARQANESERNKVEIKRSSILFVPQYEEKFRGTQTVIASTW